MATGALAVAMLLFGVSCWQISCGGGGEWQVLNAFAEAAMVGGTLDVWPHNKDGRTPLHVAVWQNEAMFDSRAKFYKLLLRHGADVDATDISTQLKLKIFEACFQILR